MNMDFLLPVMIFAISMSITPGPNNIMLTASGANFGFIKTIPHILGIVFGIAILNVLCALGLNKIFTMYPYIQRLLKYVGMIYMIFLAIKIANSNGIDGDSSNKKPLNFFQAMLFQALNPKAVLMALTAITVYSIQGELYLKSISYIVLIFFFLGMISISMWAIFGTILKSLLSNKKYLKIFNYGMGLLCGLSAVLLII